MDKVGKNLLRELIVIIILENISPKLSRRKLLRYCLLGKIFERKVKVLLASNNKLSYSIKKIFIIKIDIIDIRVVLNNLKNVR